MGVFTDFLFFFIEKRSIFITDILGFVNGAFYQITLDVSIADEGRYQYISLYFRDQLVIIIRLYFFLFLLKNIDERNVHQSQP